MDTCRFCATQLPRGRQDDPEARPVTNLQLKVWAGTAGKAEHTLKHECYDVKERRENWGVGT